MNEIPLSPAVPAAGGDDLDRDRGAMMRTLMDASTDAVLVFDRSARIVFANRGVRGVFGHDPAHLRGQPLDILLPEPVRQVHAPHFAEFVASEVPARMMSERDALRALHADGSEFPVEVSICRFVENGEEWLGAIVRDVSRRHAREAALRDAFDEARRARRTQSRFFAQISHEIRTPLNGVLGMADLLEDSLPDPAQQRMVGAIRDSGEMLLHIIDDLLDMSRIEAGKLALEVVSFTPADLARSIEATQSLRAQAKAVSFVVLADAGAGHARRGDPHRVLQIANNLVGNAVKFTESGEITVTLSARRGKPVVLTVRDTGIGMTPEQCERVFEEFEQADTSITRRFGGSGLGLSIVRRLVDLMNGAIDVQSAPGTGTTFTVTLPLPAAEPETGPGTDEAAPLLPDLTGKRALVAEDNSVNRTILQAMLARLGLEATLVRNGREAVMAGRNGGFDLMLLDISMPELDGISALGTIRARERADARPAVPAIAITANAMGDQISEYYRKGFDAHCPKPFRRTDLARAISELSLTGNANAAAPPARPEKARSGYERR